MGLFRKWKQSGSKHKKLSEENELANSLNDLSDVSDVEEENLSKTFNLKYIGNTPINKERTKTTATEAIKSVISASKTPRKKLQRVNLTVSPQGIEIADSTSGDVILRVSIYKISYCSTDGAHSNVFAFIGTENENLEGDIDHSLACYAFLCDKRKIAQNVTLTLARCFENAYKHWQNNVHIQKLSTKNNTKQEDNISKTTSESEDENICNLLIDLNPTNDNTTFSKTNFFQNTWVSFDDEQEHSAPTWEKPNTDEELSENKVVF